MYCCQFLGELIFVPNDNEKANIYFTFYFLVIVFVLVTVSKSSNSLDVSSDFEFYDS